MVWLTLAANRPSLVEPWLDALDGGITSGGLWMRHDQLHALLAYGYWDRINATFYDQMVGELTSLVGTGPNDTAQLRLDDDGLYHVYGCTSPEYKCYPPFQSQACNPSVDCNWEISQIRWGLDKAVGLAAMLHRTSDVRLPWWKQLQKQLTWYAVDSETGFRLSADCAFLCPHRHFSHLLQIFDLETLVYGSGNATLDGLIHQSIDHWYGITCNESNAFNEECRGFSLCGLAGMAVVSDRPVAAVGNLTQLFATVLTPNGWYGEYVYMEKVDMFSPVSESAYCSAGALHTMLAHTDPTGTLHILRGVPTVEAASAAGLDSGWANVTFHRLRTTQGLLTSAVRQNGSITFVRLEAAADAAAAGATDYTVAVYDAQWAAASERSGRPPLSAEAVRSVAAADVVRHVPEGVDVSRIGSDARLARFRVTLSRGEYVILYLARAGVDPKAFVIQAVPSEAAWENAFGFTEKKGLPSLH